MEMRRLKKSNKNNMYELIGLGAIYVFVHAIVICFKKLTNLTQYEKVIMWVAFVTFILLILGVMAD